MCLKPKRDANKAKNEKEPEGTARGKFKDEVSHEFFPCLFFKFTIEGKIYFKRDFRNQKLVRIVQKMKKSFLCHVDREKMLEYAFDSQTNERN